MMMDMEYKLRNNVIAKINGNQAEVIVENVYRLFITINANKVIAKYSDTILTVEFDKFDSEKLAKKIHTIVEQSHKFSIILIKEVLELISIDNLYNEIISQIKRLKETKNINALEKVYEYLSKI
jgi:hypothetical protein